MKNPPRIFIVEDCAFLREALCWTLSLKGMEVVGLTETGGEQTLSQIKALRPDLVLLDLCLPDKNGLCLLQDINRLSPPPSVLVCSGLDQKKIPGLKDKSKVQDFVDKPFGFDEIGEKIFAALSAHTQMAA